LSVIHFQFYREGSVFIVLSTYFEKTIETRVASRDDYKLYATPLTEEVVHDICSKLNLKETSENCQPDAIVYAPDLFDEIKAYFNKLPDQDKTYDTVQDYFGKYLWTCRKTTSTGHYECEYDLRGDNVFPIVFYFDENDFYDEIRQRNTVGN
jgi:hypothetical protein